MATPAEQPVGYLLKRVQAALRRRMDTDLEAHGLSMAQYAALFNLNHEPKLTNAELARRSFVTPQTMIRIVADLEDRGLIQRIPDPTNRRRLVATLTPKGRRQTNAAHETAQSIDARMLAGLDPSQIDGLRAALQLCLTNLDESEAG